MAFIRVQRLWHDELIECLTQQRKPNEAQQVMKELAGKPEQLPRVDGKTTAQHGDFMVEAITNEGHLWIDPVWFAPAIIQRVLAALGPLPEPCVQLTDEWADEQYAELKAMVRSWREGSEA